MTREYSIASCAASAGIAFGIWQGRFFAGAFMWCLLCMIIFLVDWEKE